MKFRDGQQCYVIAEIGANHNGDIKLAKKMINAAKSSNADSVKFQSWDTSLFAEEVYEKNFFLGDDYRERNDFTLKEIVSEYSLDVTQLSELREYCRQVGIDFATTPFSPEQIEEAASLDPAFIKIASMDLNNDEMLEKAGRTNLPLVLSTGFGTMAEIDHAVRTIESTGNTDLVILHCVSLYPPQDHEVNLNNLEMLRLAFGYPVGFSDHTLGTDISLASIAKGAVVLEKHFTLDKEMLGWDHHMSATPEELNVITRSAASIHAALGATRRVVSERELERRDEYRRSIVTAEPIAQGETITTAKLTLKRPGTGFEPNMSRLVVGMKAARDLPANVVLSFEDLQI